MNNSSWRSHGSGQGSCIGGKNKGSWRRDLGGLAKPASFQQANHLTKAIEKQEQSGLGPSESHNIGEWRRGQSLPSRRGRAGGRTKGPKGQRDKQGQDWRQLKREEYSGGEKNPNPLLTKEQDWQHTPPSNHGSKSTSLPVKECQTIEDLIQLASKHGTLTPKNLSAFWSRIPYLLDSKSYQSRDARAHEELKRKFKSILATTVNATNRFDAQDVSTLALGMAKIVNRLPSNRTDARSDFFQPLVVKCNVGPQNIFCLLATRACSLTNFNAQDLTNLAYAYAIVEYLPTFSNGSALLFDHIASQAINAKVRQRLAPTRNRLGGLKPRELANIAWAFAKVKASHPCLFKKVANTVVESDLSAFKPQDLSSTVWAFATAKEKHPRLFEKVGDHLLETELSAFDPQALANIVWAYATAKEAHPRLFKEIADSIVAKGLESFSPQALSNIVWAFAKAGVYNTNLFGKIACAAVVKRDKFKSQHIANTLWAYAVAGRAPEGLFISFEHPAKSLINECNTQEIANIAWAFAVANVAAFDLFGERFVDAVCEKEDELYSEALSQLHQWQLWQQELGSHTILPVVLRERCRDAFTSHLVQSSNFQRDVVRELSAMGLHPEEEVLMPSGYRLDALVEVGGQSLGIEVDGPHHFIACRPTGKTVIKRRQVPSIDGVAIVPVPYWEWGKVGRRRIDRRQYLSDALGMI